ncbi:MAG: hypothetical protein E6K13_02440 [Methanobacteriota archaeon]|nr:MAG: hypothetical protein E6K13_02440 [Euryarchaeota archaeon]
MQIGCGVRTLRIKNRDYLYFWHYEKQDGRRRAIHEYMGPVRDPSSARKAVEALEVYTRKAMEEARRRLLSEKAHAFAASR